MDIYASILALALISGQLIRLPFFGGGITVLDLAVAALCLYGLFNLKFKLKRPPFFIAGVVFILIALLSLILTPLHLSFSEYMNAFSYTGRFFLYFLLAIVIFSLQKNFTKGFILAGSALAALGILQLIFLPDLRFLAASGWDPHFFRNVSTFLDPNFLGAFLVLTLILIVQRQRSKFTLFLFTLVYIALLTTFSRSSYLMLLISGLTFSLLKKSIRYAILTLVLFGILLLGFQIYSRLVAEPRNISREQSASFRLNAWQQGLTLFQKYPVLGIGFNTYRYGLKQLNLGDEQFLQSHGSSGNDSSLLFVASTTGIVGLLTYLYFLSSILRGNRLILLPAVLGLIVHSFFANSLFYPPVLAWLLLTGAGSKK